MKRLFLFSSLVLLFVSGQVSAAILPEPKKISQHVYAWFGPYEGPNEKNRGFRMNLGFVVGKDAVAVFDSGFYSAMAEEMVSHIRAITPLPIKYVINTNSQPDRMMGNDVFRKLGAEIITSAPEAQRMDANGNNYAMMLEMTMKFKQSDIRLPARPTRIISKPEVIDLGGGVTLDIHLHKAAHTPLPLIVHVPSDKLVYAGDVLYNGRLLAIVPGGNIREWMETFNYLKRFGDVTFFPGHGRPGKLKDFQVSTYEYLQMLDSHMTRMLEEGVDMQDAINRLDQSKFSHLANYKDLAGRNANRAYQEAERAAFE